MLKIFQYLILISVFIISACKKDKDPVLQDKVLSKEGRYYFTDSYFADSLHGFLVGSNEVILRTTDGGRSWTHRQYGKDSYREDITILSKVFFLDNNTGWVTGIVVHSDSCVVGRTVNGGVDWSFKTLASDKIGSEIYFINSLKGFLISRDNYYFSNSILDLNQAPGETDFFLTQDGGISWSPISLPATGIINSVCFKDENIGFVVGNNGLVFKTTDGGSSWKKINLEIKSPENLLNVFFANSSDGYITGTNGTFLKSTDGGESWRSIGTFRTTFGFTTLTYPVVSYHKNSLILNSVGFGLNSDFLYSTDGGFNWETKRLEGYNSDIRTMNLIDSNAAIVSCSRFNSADFKNYNTIKRITIR